jgi:hypothetical protein
VGESMTKYKGILDTHPFCKERFESTSFEWATGLILFVAVFVFLAFAMLRIINPYDEGIILTGASRVLAGALPHRDFYANYGPGQFLAVAVVFKLFGSSVLAERILDLVIKAGVACIVCGMSLGLMGRIAAMIVTGISVIWLAALGEHGYPVWASMLLTLLAARAIFPALEGRYSAAFLAASGICVGLIVLFRYDVGFLVCVSLSSILAAFGLIENRHEGTLLAKLMRLLLPFWIGIGLIFVPLAAGYAVAGVVSDFVFQVIQFPSKYYVNTRSLPFPRGIYRSGWDGIVQIRLMDLIVYLPLLTVLLAMASVAFARDRVAEISGALIVRAWTWKVVLLAALALTLFFKGIVRASALHMALSIIPAFVVLGATACRSLLEPVVRWQQRVTQMLVVVALGLTSIASLHAAGTAFRRISQNVRAVLTGELFAADRGQGHSAEGSCRQRDDLERARCFAISDAEAQTIHFIRQNTAANEAIFAGLGRHDKILVNNAAFYFLADRPPATKWYHFDPGLQTSRVIQEEIVAELEARAVRYVVTTSEWDNINEPNESAISSNVLLLDEYIRNNYDQIKALQPFKIFKRRAG